MSLGHAHEVEKADPSEARVERAFLGRVRVMQHLVDGVSRRADKDPLLTIQAFEDLPVERVMTTELLAALEEALLPFAQAAVVEAQAEAAAVTKDRVADLAAEFANIRGSALVRRISQDVRTIIRAVVADGIRFNNTIQQMAAELRPVIGLLPRDRRAALALRRRLRASGVDVVQADKAVGKYCEKKIKERALTIARTEASEAIHQAKLIEWNEQIGTGQLRPDVERRWIAKDPCEVCRTLAAMGPIPFMTPWETKWGSFMAPPAHPRCKCAVVLVPPRRKPRE